MRRWLCLAIVCGALVAGPELARTEDLSGWDGVLFGGMTQADLRGSDQPFSDSGSRYGFVGGVGFLLRLNEEMGMEFGMRFAQKGADGTVDLTDYDKGASSGTERITGTGTTKLNYIELPVTFAGYLPTGQQSYLRGYVGTSLGILTGARYKGTLLDEPVEVDIKDSLSSVDLCWLVGASWTYEMESISVWFDARYVSGTRSIDDSIADFDVKTSTGEFVVGVGMPLSD